MNAASKETVDNLIMNTSKTIEDLYRKVKEDEVLLRVCDRQTSTLLLLMLELRRDVRFMVIDLMTSLRVYLNYSNILNDK